MQEAVGAGVLLPEPRKPKPVVWPPAMVPFQAALRSVEDPAGVCTLFHDWVTVCPPEKVRVTCQPEMDALPLFLTVTAPWNPLFQKLVTLYVAVQPVPVG